MTPLPPNAGHGWVVPPADGMRARCGGPGLCMSCQAEELLIRAERQRGVSQTQPTPGVYDPIQHARNLGES